MKKNQRRAKSALLPVLAVSLPFGSLAAADYPVQPVPFTDVSFTSGLWHDRQEINNKVTLPFAIEQCDTSKRLENFDLAADTMKRRAAGDKAFQHKPPTVYPFDDSDVYKVLEGAAFCLSVRARRCGAEATRRNYSPDRRRAGTGRLPLHLADDAS